MQVRDHLKAEGNFGAQGRGAKRRTGSIPNRNFKRESTQGVKTLRVLAREPHHPNNDGDENEDEHKKCPTTPIEVTREPKRVDGVVRAVSDIAVNVTTKIAMRTDVPASGPNRNFDG
jgi:hypothetical protein